MNHGNQRDLLSEREQREESEILRRVEHLEHEAAGNRGLLEKILRLLETPTLTAFQVGDLMAIGSIAPGASGQFACAVNYPAGVNPPPTPLVVVPSSPDQLITFAPATVDQTNGAIPLAQQFVATVDPTDTKASGKVAFAALGTDGETILASNVVTFDIPQAPPPPPAEPTLVASQVA